MNLDKPILFYSTYCQHSREILSLLQKNNVLDSLLLINISSNKYKIPSFIKSVPTIYFNKQILSDSELENFLNNNIINKTDSTIDAFFPSEMNSGIGYSYSYLGSDNDNIKNSLMYIDNMTDSKINTPDENEFLNSSDKAINMNKLTEQREHDLQKILNTDKNSEQRNFIR
jgi:hypothetical protein